MCAADNLTNKGVGCQCPHLFWRINFLSLWCYCGDLLVCALFEELALEQLELVFSCLYLYDLKLVQNKCWLLSRSVRFLGHIIDESGVSTDPAKVKVVSTCLLQISWIPMLSPHLSPESGNFLPRSTITST